MKKVIIMLGLVVMISGCATNYKNIKLTPVLQLRETGELKIIDVSNKKIFTLDKESVQTLKNKLNK